jgi:tetratricopeptide (TPR) repeat protein
MMEKPFSYQDTYGFIADYTKAIEFDNVSWRYVSRSRGKVNIKDYKGALADCNIAISMAEKKGEREHIFSAYHQRADIFVFLQDYKSAIADLEKALKNTEQNGFAGAMLSSMADYAKELKDYDASMKYIERAITVYQKINDATEGTMYYNRGLLKIEHLNKKEEGCADFKKAISFYKPEETGMIDMVKDAIKAHCN